MNASDLALVAARHALEAAGRTAADLDLIVEVTRSMGMMGGMHGGQSVSMMGSGWRSSDGSYGMMFSFTTA